eukprot:6002017-Pyramimonas_sp.AAC.1
MEARIVAQGCRAEESQIRAGAPKGPWARCTWPWPLRPRRTGASRPATRWRPTCSRVTSRGYHSCACRPRTLRRGPSLARSRWPLARSTGRATPGGSGTSTRR